MVVRVWEESEYRKKLHDVGGFVQDGLKIVAFVCQRCTAGHGHMLMQVSPFFGSGQFSLIVVPLAAISFGSEQSWISGFPDFGFWISAESRGGYLPRH
jgi:hypothetical protein